MGKRYIAAILVVIFAYIAIIVWHEEGSEIFQKFLSRQGQVVAFDQLESEEDEYSYVEDMQEPIPASPEEVFSPGNFVENKEALGFAEKLENLAVNAITVNKESTIKPLSGGTIALLLQQYPITINDAISLETLETNPLSRSLEKKLLDYYKWLYPS